VLIANSPYDRLIDWTGEYNNYYVPFNPYGLGTVTRLSSPGLIDFLLQMAASDGADVTAGIAYGGDPARYGEPYGELGLVIKAQDDESKDQKGGAHMRPRPPTFKWVAVFFFTIMAGCFLLMQKSLGINFTVNSNYCICRNNAGDYNGAGVNA
jgi:hypothetical protein